MSSIVPIEDVLPYTQSIASSGQQQFDTNWTADTASDVMVYARATGVVANDATQLISPSLYTVTFVGAEQFVRVTFLIGRTLSDIVTLTRLTPVDRDNLYINTNFTPSMLNGDFGRQTMMIQERELLNVNITPRYNTSATVTPIVDTILPILPAGYIWRKKDDNTGIEALPVPDTIAPAIETFLTFSDETADLPNSYRLIAGTNVTLTAGVNQLTVSVTGQAINPGLINDLAYYANNGSVVSPLTTENSSVLVTDGSGVPSLSTTLPAGLIIPGYQPSITPAALTKVDDTNITLTLGGTPASALLQDVSITVGWDGVLSLARGGTNKALTANNGGIVYSDADSLEILAGTVIANQMLISGSNAAPSWSTLTSLIDTVISSTQGSILYRNNTAWVGLGPGTSGEFLKTQGAAANPIWAPGDGSGTVTSVGSGTGLTGGPITSSGTLSVAGALASIFGLTTVANNLIYTTASNTYAVIVPVANAILMTDGSSVPSLSTTTPSGLTIPQPLIQGVTDGSSASLGVVGYYVSNQIVQASAVSISSGTPTNLTSISLAPGDYDLWANVAIMNSGFNLSLGQVGISLVSATQPDTSLTSAINVSTGIFQNIHLAAPSQRLSLSVTTTVYLVATANFALGTSTMSGLLASRVRR